ncbi:N, N'-diacetylbacillosaminyl-diphospho-undecaprenol alpha-1,3-N-acetylgalactosaminyltransferase [Vibrio chagasii]|nr:N, N'-diacetylbacillosaminyl-diphospho-undecaprenol alpha-1,3-N-acetylgalactosaminyltransferase [Vibrio chagasii]
MKTLFVVNSILNKPGNIGYRLGKVIDNHRGDFSILCRGGNSKSANKSISMGLFGHLPRILNAIRIYLFPQFKHRKYDKLIFEIFFIINILRVLDRTRERKIAHIMEYSPLIIKILKKYNYHIILDVPIGPSSYMQSLVDIHGDDFSDIGAIYMDKFERKSFSLSDTILVPSLFVKKELMKSGVEEDKVKIIQFGVDIEKGCVKKDTNFGKPNLDYVFAGMLCKRKGLEYLLEAWSDRNFKYDKLHLCGRVTPEVRSLIAKKGLKNVVLPGFVDTSEYFKDCDVYVFPSLLEGSSKSIYEAMNSSLPVITTIESGSIVEDKVHGYIVPRCNVMYLREKMIKIKDVELRKQLSINAYQHVQKFTWNEYVNNVCEIYRKIEL